MRWTALGVDYEMAGKDLIDFVTLSSRICQALGGTPPESFNYELFLDDKGEKISKSKGNGLTIDEWLTYASPESLSLFMFQKPKSAKRLYFDVIPRAVDEYLQFLAAYPRQDGKAKLDNAVWHIHAGNAAGGRAADHVRAAAEPRAPPRTPTTRTCCGASSAAMRRASGPQTHPLLDHLAGYAVRYYEDFVKPQEEVPPADEVETAALRALSEALGKALRRARRPRSCRASSTTSGARCRATRISTAKGATPEQPGVSNAWFNAIYEVLLGEEKGPRFGSFIELYGVKETRALIDKALNGELTKAA